MIPQAVISHERRRPCLFLLVTLLETINTHTLIRATLPEAIHDIIAMLFAPCLTRVGGGLKTNRADQRGVTPPRSPNASLGLFAKKQQPNFATPETIRQNEFNAPGCRGTRALFRSKPSGKPHLHALRKVLQLGLGTMKFPARCRRDAS